MEAVCQTGSFMREGARDNQPSPASLFLSQHHHHYYTVLHANQEPDRGPVAVLGGCPVMKVSERVVVFPRNRLEASGGAQRRFVSRRRAAAP